MAKLQARVRNALPDSAFAVPAKRKLPIHDASHALAASRVVGRTDDLSSREKALARQRIATAVAHFSHKEIDGTASGNGDYKDVLCDACMANVPQACMCASCDPDTGRTPMPDLRCSCDMAAMAQLRKDYDTGMGLQPYYIDGQHRIKDAAGTDVEDVMDKAADLSDGPLTYFSVAAKYDKNTALVQGIVSNETLDSDQQIADKKWLDVALPEWMKWGNMRQMHQPIAAGKALKITEEGTGYNLLSKVVNQETKRLFDEDVLQAYSIGIRNPVIVSDPVAKNGRIVGGKIVEVSYVDHPANPDSRVAISKFADGVLSPLTTQIEEHPMEASGMLEAFKHAQPTPPPDLDALAARQAAAALDAPTASKDAADGDKPRIVPTDSGANADPVGQVERMTADSPTPMSADQLLTELATLEHRQKEVKAQLEALSRESDGKPGSLFDLPGGKASEETTLQPLATPASEQSWHGGPLKAAVADALAELLGETLTKDASEMAQSPLLKFLDAAVAAKVGDVQGRLEAIERMAAPLRGVTAEKVLANTAGQPTEAEQALLTLSKAARAGQLSEADQLKAAAAISAERMRARFGTN